MVGTPNVGKTSLVNAVAGSGLEIGNWPGTTVEVKSARARLGCGDVTLIDLPGAYTLAGTAPDEEVLLPALAADPDALVVNVVDATHLSRDLTLTLELTELGMPMIVALNLVDQAAAQGHVVNAATLEQRLGVPVVAVRAHVGTGVSEVVAAASRATAPRPMVTYPPELDAAIRRLDEMAPDRWHAVAALADELPASRPAPRQRRRRRPGSANAETAETPATVPVRVPVGASSQSAAVSARVSAQVSAATLASAGASERAALPDASLDAFLAIAEARHQAAHALAEAATRTGSSGEDPSERIDRILLNPYLGPFVLLAGLATTFHFTFALSDPWVAFLGSVQAVLAGWIETLPLPALATSFLSGAVVEGVGTVVAFVPVLFTLYAILGFLENAGVLSRVAYLADGLMRAIGLPGRAVLPMVLSLGCTVPAIQSTRMLDQRSDRLRVALSLPSIPCSARLPVFVLLAAAFVPEYAGLVITGLYLVGFAVAILSAFAFKHLLGKDSGSAAMELPAYRLPPVRLVLRLAWLRTRAFLASAGGPILIAVVAVWALLTLQLPGGASVFETVSRALAPLFAPLGLGDWRIVGALIPGAIAKEVVIGSLALTFTGGEATAALGLASGLLAIGAAFVDAVQGTITSLWGFALATEAPDGTLGARLSGAVTTGGAIALMVFTLLYVPCVATLAAIRKAFGTHYMLFSVGYQLAVAYGAAFLAFRIFG
ncbi:MAG: ferrous iron transport protein B [Trueperaceae bacterium]|nr:ferrous iron transport protein B [Trueperaceae bacterium]